MLDKRSEALLNIINHECNEGSYKVIEIDDLIRLMPNKFKVDFDMINQLMGYLRNGEYISIKYSDKEVFCVSPSPRGRRIFEVEQEEIREVKRKTFKFFILSFFYLILIFGVCLGASYLSRFI
ncbi:MAG: hypothetical protein PHS54_04775 [Clostridia bacterium]|nr:hypothetical protein [Clostridia bacterium]